MKKSVKILLALLIGIPALILGIFALVKLYYFKTWQKHAKINGNVVPLNKQFWTDKFAKVKQYAIWSKNNEKGSLEVNVK